MKLSLGLIGLTLTVCSLVSAQDTGDRVVVPARNTNHPRRVDVSLMHGSITVKAYNGKEVIVESPGARSSNRTPERTPDGLRRLDMPMRGLSVEEDDNVVTIRMRSNQAGAVTVSVPPDTSLKLHTLHGEIRVEGVNGEIDVDSLNGNVTLSNVSGNVLAHSLNGTIKATVDRVDQSKPMSFSTLNGTIDVTLPQDFKANVKLTADHGEIYSDFDFKLSGSLTQKNDTSDGKFKVSIDRSGLVGTINGGGADATFHTYNGTIYIRKKK